MHTLLEANKKEDLFNDMQHRIIEHGTIFAILVILVFEILLISNSINEKLPHASEYRAFTLYVYRYWIIGL